MNKTVIILIFSEILISIGWARTTVTIDVSKPGADISPTMYGVFFEDINFGADGGLYAELVKNRLQLFFIVKSALFFIIDFLPI